MGKKEKKKHKYRSRSRSRSRDRSHKKEKRRRRSPSSSSNSSDSSRDRRHGGKKSHKSDRSKDKHVTVQDIETLREEKRKQKELVKALETPEEKRARRLAKKELKERKRKAKMGWDDEYLGYTNTDNPFGDERLLDTFVWGKKMDKEGKADYQKEEIEKDRTKRMIDNKMELEKVKKRRLEREREREQRDEEREMMQRDKEAEYYREWEKQEDTFHLEQAKLRSQIRIEDGRAKPIDLLAKYITAEDEESVVEMHEPYTYLNGLTIQDLEDLLEDIKVYMELEQGKNAEYWRDITIITEEELSELRKIDPEAVIGERRTGVNKAVVDEVAGVFKGKSLSQLKLLEDNITKKLQGGEGIDVGYWESLLQQLKAHMAKTRLKERHQEQLRRKLFKLKQEQGIESAPLFPIIRQEQSNSRSASPATAGPSHEGPSTSQQGPSTSQESGEGDEALVKVKEEGEEQEDVQPGTSAGTQEEDKEEGHSGSESEEEAPPENAPEDQSYLDYDTGRYSPVMLRVGQLEPDTLVIDEEDDDKRLEYARSQVVNTGKAKDDADLDLLKRAKEGMTNEEAQFSVEIPVQQRALIWSDKYRPRKPRFFNRVHTGFEWNKYNQTHYDIDNPPPKIVQGYKFNIFYPDLMDKTVPPTYTVTPLEDSPDFAVLRFSAGPPYEDIGFKIVNREWEYSYKKGFRCQFYNNIFQLWFHFKRYRYRR